MKGIGDGEALSVTFSLGSCLIALVFAVLLAAAIRYATTSTRKKVARSKVAAAVQHMSPMEHVPESSHPEQPQETDSLDHPEEETSAPTSPFADPPAPILLQLQIEEAASSSQGEVGSPGPSPSSARDIVPELPTFIRRKTLTTIASAPDLGQTEASLYHKEGHFGSLSTEKVYSDEDRDIPSESTSPRAQTASSVSLTNGPVSASGHPSSYSNSR